MLTYSFTLYNDDGSANSEAAVSFLHYGLPSGAWHPDFGADVDSIRDPPTIVNMGNGLYRFTPSETDIEEGVVYLIESDANPRYLAGGVGTSVALLYTQDGEPVSSDDTISFLYFLNAGSGDPVEPPPINQVYLGLYAFKPETIPEEGIAYRVSLPMSDTPEVDGVIDPVVLAEPPVPPPPPWMPPPVLPDEDVVTGNRLAETFRSLAYYPPNSERFVAKTCQLVIRFNSTGGTGGPSGDVRFRSFGIRYNVLGRRPA